MLKPGDKEYIGDGCYLTFDGYGFILTTENGVETTNLVYLDPETLRNLFSFIKDIYSLKS